MNKKYIFIKSYVTPNGTIPEGSEITSFRGHMFINGGLCLPAYEALLKHIMDDEKLHKEYLKDMVIEKNEF